MFELPINNVLNGVKFYKINKITLKFCCLIRMQAHELDPNDGKPLIFIQYTDPFCYHSR